MEDFLEAKALLERIGAGFMVKDRDELVKKAKWLMGNPDEFDHLGKRAGKIDIQCFRKLQLISLKAGLI